MPPYAVDLRERIVQAVHDGANVRSVAHRFAVSASTVRRYVAKHRHDATLQPKTPPGAKKRLLPDQLTALESHVQGSRDGCNASRTKIVVGEETRGLCLGGDGSPRFSTTGLHV